MNSTTPSFQSAKSAATQRGPTISSSAFDPALPEDGALIIAEVLRDQFNALNDDIQTRAREITLAADVASLQVQLQDRPTYPEMDGAISTAVADKVTQAEMGNAISTAISYTAANPSSMSPLSLTISDPPTQYEVQQMVDWMNNLFAGLYRAP